MTTEKRVLFLCAETFPPPYAFLQKVFNEQLREQGFRFVWIMPSMMETGEIKETDWDGNPVILIPKIRPQGMADLIQVYWKHLKNIQRASQLASERYGSFRILQVRDDPAMAYVGWRLAKRVNISFVYQLSHLKEEELMMYTRMRIYGNPIKNAVQGRVGFFLRNFFLRRADLVFPISDQMKKTLASYGVPTSRIVTLPEGADTSIEPMAFDEEAKAIRKKLGLQDKKVITYVGTMNRFRQLDFLLGVLKLVLLDHPKAHLLMVGTGKDPEDLEWLKAKTSELGVQQNVTFTGWVSREKVPAYIRGSDVGVSPIPTNGIYINSSPIKLLEYLALEVPVVATDIPEQKRIIEESGAGICVPWDREKFAGAIEEILNLTDAERRAMGQRGRAWVQKYRDFSVLAERVYRAYDGILSG
jgi:glycosyltransferase involved in cell wall biosynthesis